MTKANQNVPQVWIVVTSINNPTDAIIKIGQFAQARKWTAIVIGDTKSPSQWSCEGVKFLSIDDQRQRLCKFTDMLPTKHYSRKNIGYLLAAKAGASLILETDDDNIPYQTFGPKTDPMCTGDYLTGGKWINFYRQYSDEKIWPRGLPLDSIHEHGKISTADVNRTYNCPIEQYLADDDPDVDAIYRLTNDKRIQFKQREKAIIIDNNSYVPFNSQNTTFHKVVFPLMYLPSFVSFRMTDIWRSFVAQRVLRALELNISVHNATVRQERNTHNLMKDFSDEVVGYLKNREIGQILDSIDLRPSESICDMLYKCYESLVPSGIIQDREMPLVAAWIEAIERKPHEY